MTNIQDLVGKEVKIYPKDSYKKRGILLSVDSNGYTFEITFSEDIIYKEKDIWFISQATGVTILLHK